MTTYTLETKDPTFRGVIQQAKIYDSWSRGLIKKVYLKPSGILAILVHPGYQRIKGLLKELLFNDVWYTESHQKEQIKDQQEYARLCCQYLIPIGLQEPHCVADDLPEDCNCCDCLSEKVEKDYERIDAYREFRDELRGGGAWE